MKKPGVEALIAAAWNFECKGSIMHKAATKIKRCRVELLKWNSQGQGNAAKWITLIQIEMERLKEEGGNRD